MNHQDAVARQHSLREGQTARARLHGGVDRDRLADVAEEDGVPMRYAKVGRGDLGAKGSPPYEAASKAIESLCQPGEDLDGLIVFGSSPHYAGRLAGAIYTGAMVRGRAARWHNFPEMADNFTRKISLDQNNEWDVGEITDWNIDLDSTRYCYDLVVIHGVTHKLLTPYVATELYKIIAARAVRGLFTVVTATSSQVEVLWGEMPELGTLVGQQFYKHMEK